MTSRPDPAASVEAALLADPHVRRVELVGSRAGGTPSPLSDWDFVITTDDPDATMAALPSLVAPLEPLAEQWDPLGPTAYRCYMLMLRGPAKIDLIFPGVPHEPAPAWTATAGSLDAIDRHFWDWILWLTSKEQRGRGELVDEQLALMATYLLGPMGVEEVPASIASATREYLAARERLERGFGVRVPREVGDEVLPVLPAGSRGLDPGPAPGVE